MIAGETRYYGIATARHVVTHAAKWQTPIRLYRHGSDSPELYKEDDRVILMDPTGKDLAVLLIGQRELDLPSSPIELLPPGVMLPLGTEVGWIGYPFDFSLCFFSGRISSGRGDFSQSSHEYLIDGVAISGVSGGPVFVKDRGSRIEIIGSITAYRPNRTAGETLPGLSIAQDVSDLRMAVNAIQSVDETRGMANDSATDSETSK